MTRLKGKVMTRVKAKTVNGHALNGPMLIELAQSYIKALNEGHVPVIESAWTNVCHFEQERIFKQAQQHCEMQISQRLRQNRLHIADVDVKGVLREIREEAVDMLRKDFLGEAKQLDQYTAKLVADFKAQAKAVVNEVRTRQDDALREIITKRVSEELEGRIRRCDPGLSTFE